MLRVGIITGAAGDGRLGSWKSEESTFEPAQSGSPVPPQAEAEFRVGYRVEYLTVYSVMENRQTLQGWKFHAEQAVALAGPCAGKPA